MTQRAEYLIQILEKIGTPLITSIMAAKKDGQDDQAMATDVATLLAKSTQLSIELGAITELSKAGIANDSVRVALAALAGPIVGESYAQDGTVPDDGSLKKVGAAFQAVLSFADNFTPDPETAQRLENVQAQGTVVDVHQATIQYIDAFTPVINAITIFSFGQVEQKIVMEIASKLVAKTADFNVSVFGKLDEVEQKRVDLASIRILADLYAACHKAETQRILMMSEEERAAQPQAPGGGLALDEVWNKFNVRLAMLSAIAKNTLPANLSAGGGQAPAPVAAPIEAPVAQAPEPPLVVQEATPPAAPEAAPATSGNPMSMFAKKETDSTTAETPAAPPPEAAPPANPAPVAPIEPPPAPPAETPPAETGSDDSAGESSGTGGGPMSFFKKE